MTLLTPTQDSRDIINAAVKCLDKIWKEGHRYQKAGIMLGDFFSGALPSSICLTTARRVPEVKS